MNRITFMKKLPEKPIMRMVKYRLIVQTTLTVKALKLRALTALCLTENVFDPIKYYETKQIEYEELENEGSGFLTDDEDFV